MWNHCTWERMYLPGSSSSSLSLVIIIYLWPYQCQLPHLLLSYDILSLGKLLEKPLHSQWCNTSSEPWSAGKISTSIRLVKSDLSLEAPRPLLQWTKWSPCWSPVGGGSIQTMAVLGRLSTEQPWKAGGQVELRKSGRGHKMVRYQIYGYAYFCEIDHVLLNGKNPLLSFIFVSPEAKGKVSLPDWTKPGYNRFSFFF